MILGTLIIDQWAFQYKYIVDYKSNTNDDDEGDDDEVNDEGDDVDADDDEVTDEGDGAVF